MKHLIMGVDIGMRERTVVMLLKSSGNTISILNSDVIEPGLTSPELDKYLNHLYEKWEKMYDLPIVRITG